MSGQPMAAAVEQISAAAAADTEGLGLEEQMTKLLLKLDGVAVGEDTAQRAARKAADRQLRQGGGRRRRASSHELLERVRARVGYGNS